MTGSLPWALALLAAGLAGAATIELRRRAELVARACHEVRGPLAAASLALHAAEREAVGLELRRAGLALDDLQAASRGRRADSDSETVDVAQLVAVQAGTWRAVAAACGRELRMADCPAGRGLVRGDRVRLSQAISNLLANAVEHGAGTVEVCVRRAAGRVRIEVADEGAGLPRPVAALAAAPPRGRRGRGLTIAAAIARDHGGRLAGAPAAGGARVALELPAAAVLHPLELLARGDR